MKSKLLGLAAIGILALPMAATAGVIYQFTGAGFSAGQSFVLETSDFIGSDTSVPIGDLQSCTTGNASLHCTALDFRPNVSIGPITVDNLVLAIANDTGTFAINTGFLFADGAFGAYGTYATAVGKATGTLTVSESTTGAAIPEPATLSMLGLSVIAVGCIRRRAKD